MSQVLVDSSVWVEMFRKGDSPEVRTLGELLRRGWVCTNGLIRAEILSGARSKVEYRRLSELLSALILLPDPLDLWDRVARTRYGLARKGFQAAIADLVVAVSASYHRKTLFTLDRAFLRLRGALHLELLSVSMH